MVEGGEAALAISPQFVWPPVSTFSGSATESGRPSETEGFLFLPAFTLVLILMLLLDLPTLIHYA